jgi:hypothetical protein
LPTSDAWRLLQEWASTGSQHGGGGKTQFVPALDGRQTVRGRAQCAQIDAHEVARVEREGNKSPTKQRPNEKEENKNACRHRSDSLCRCKQECKYAFPYGKNGIDFVPMVVEVFGAFHPEALK